MPGQADPIMEIAQYQRAESIIHGYPDPPIITESITTPHYRPSTDTVSTPPMSHAVSPEAYYSVMFHELAHSAGHAKRLNRPLENKFGTKEYAREELIAEMAACFLCAEAGIEPMIDNSASYIDSWLGALKKDHNLVVVAAGKAQHATNHILNRKETTTTPETTTPSLATA
jgi:antirestriction protein ArdC